MIVSLIAAVANNRAIGLNGDLPWHLPEDMRFFKETTRGHHVITGRGNYEAMGRPLPGRTNIVVSRTPSFRAPCAVVPSVEEALSLARAANEQEAFVIGGAEIYRLAMPWADRFYRTKVLADVPGTTFFPVFDESEWDSRVLFEHPVDDRHAYAFVVELLTRRGSRSPEVRG